MFGEKTNQGEENVSVSPLHCSELNKETVKMIDTESYSVGYEEGFSDGIKKATEDLKGFLAQFKS